MKLSDPDLYVRWDRCDEPGENPTWESQCGRIEQTSFGENPLFRGFVSTNTIVGPTSTFSSIKTIIEQEYQKTTRLGWSYDDREL